MSRANLSAQLTSLSWQAHRPSMLLRWPNITILLDCSIDMSALNHFLPFTYTESPRMRALTKFHNDHPTVKRMKTRDRDTVFIDEYPEVHPTPLKSVQMDTVDAIVVSNWTSLVALPFYTEGTGFKGVVYTTDPTLQFGRLVIEELIEYHSRVVTNPSEQTWKADLYNTFPNLPYRSPMEWKQFYSTEMMESALNRVTVVAFGEPVKILSTITLTAQGSGFAMGSCNWLISNEREKIGYIASSSSRSSHTRLVDWDQLKNADKLIMTSLTRSRDPPDISVQQVVKTSVETLKSGGNVLIPIQPTGIIFDLIELLAKHMDKQGVSLDVPLYFISPVAKKSLAFANVNAEWLSEEKQNNVYLPEEPFLHANLIKNGRLKIYESLYGAFSRELRTPCVVFAGHPSLRVGDAAHLLEMWGNDKRNALIMTDPDYPLNEVYGPFEDLSIRAYSFPVDTRIDFATLNASLLPELKPSLLYIPDAYGKRDGMVFVQYQPHTVVRYEDTLNVSNKNKKKRVQIHPELLKRLQVGGFPSNLEVGTGPLRGYLCAYDNAYEIVPAKRFCPVRPRYTGILTSHSLMNAMKERDIKATLIEDETRGVYIVRTESPESTITLYKDGLKTNVEANEKDRPKVMDIIGSCLEAL